MTRTERARWLKWFGHDGHGDVRLFCFHHAGGSAARFRNWPNLLPQTVEPIAVQLPGRADRLGERPFDAMEPLIEPLVEVLAPLLDGRFAFCGHSMGGKVAWALAHALRDRAMPQPVALYVINVAAPMMGEGRTNWNIGEAELVTYLRKMGGTPPELFAEPKLLAALLPTFRADLTLVDSFRYRPLAPLNMPIRAFAGAEDADCGPGPMADWRDETTASFALDVIPGGHFPDAAGERHVIDSLIADLLPQPPNELTMSPEAGK